MSWSITGQLEEVAAVCVCALQFCMERVLLCLTLCDWAWRLCDCAAVLRVCRVPIEASLSMCGCALAGNVLAVSAADNKVTLWKQALDGNWQNVGEVNEPVS